MPTDFEELGKPGSGIPLGWRRVSKEEEVEVWEGPLCGWTHRIRIWFEGDREVRREIERVNGR